MRNVLRISPFNARGPGAGALGVAPNGVKRSEGALGMGKRAQRSAHCLTFTTHVSLHDIRMLIGIANIFTLSLSVSLSMAFIAA